MSMLFFHQFFVVDRRCISNLYRAFEIVEWVLNQLDVLECFFKIWIRESASRSLEPMNLVDRVVKQRKKSMAVVGGVGGVLCEGAKFVHRPGIMKLNIPDDPCPDVVKHLSHLDWTEMFSGLKNVSGDLFAISILHDPLDVYNMV